MFSKKAHTKDAVSSNPGNDIDPDGDPLVITDVRIASPASNQERNSAEASPTRAINGTPLTGIYGTLTLNADGSYSYSADQDNCDPLDPGDIANERFIYTLSDGFSTTDAQLSISINGRNDAPRFDQQVIQATIRERPGSSETITAALNGTFNASDPDADAVLTYSTAATENISSEAAKTTKGTQSNTQSTTTTNGDYGELNLNITTGDYIYTPRSTAVEALKEGEVGIDVYRINVSDGHRISLNGLVGEYHWRR